ncbi:glycosyltransferase family 39 protein [Micromonospora sp. NPDC047793]|uniref:ArnT family glycosyltransferase n=1 Tax=unclassified Micromonospora TaxID=2617518 RepID=UPI0010351DDF|nr:glycosyltransferase family 39 protein [Verrucosispora sp. SN26_14.1]TBL45453.1 glycosyl transferase, family 39 [Verrucosispora sp. SN26_14.1]
MGAADGLEAPSATPLTGASGAEVGNAGEQNDHPRLAWKALLTLAIAIAVPLLLTVGRYGLSDEEYYFISAGRHLDWGYADQPPLVPLVARLMDTIAPGSTFMMRLPDVFLLMAGVLLVGQLAREFGARGRAQFLAACGYSVAFLPSGCVLDTDTFSDTLWLVIMLLVTRWVRLYRQGRAIDVLLIWAGVATAVSLQVKFQVLILWAAIVLAVLVAGPQDMLRRRALWIGFGIAGLTAIPTMAWQATHGWPQLRMTGVLAAENLWFFGPWWTFFTYLLLMTGMGIGTVLAIIGLWKLFRWPGLQDFRFLGWTSVLVIALVFVTRGRFTYAIGVFPLLYAAAAVYVQSKRPAWWWRWTVSLPIVALSFFPPVTEMNWKPESSITQPQTKAELLSRLQDVRMLGWPEYTDSVSRAYHSLPPEVAARATIVTQHFGQAGVLEVLGTREPYNLPKPYSASRGFGYFDRPKGQVGTVMWVGGSEEDLRAHFRDVRQIGEVTARVNPELGTAIWLCEASELQWSELWPQIQSLQVI